MNGSEGTPERRRHRATAFVSKNNDEAGAEILDRVFNTAESVVIDQIAGRADDKEVANVLIEDDLGCGPRISASDNDGKWMLCLRRFRAARCDRFGRAVFATGKPLVARLQASERLIARDCWC